jgi:hypothetical protein
MRNVKGAMLLRFHKLSLAAAILLGVGCAQNALAQSTGTDAIEESMNEVVVSATRVRNIGIVSEQTAPKSRISLSGEYLQSQTPGNTLFQGLNQIPGVNFTNSDPYGNSGGNLRLRSFDGSRVSVTFDGVPLNDSGNYALFTNQQLDPELVDRVDVNLGTTDVDSPTASATGGTISYKTKKPTDDMGGEATLSGGDFNYKRAFARFDTGQFGPLGTKAFIAASYTDYDKFKEAIQRRRPPGFRKRQLHQRLFPLQPESQCVLPQRERGELRELRLRLREPRHLYARCADHWHLRQRQCNRAGKYTNSGSARASIRGRPAISDKLRQLLRRAHQPLGHRQHPRAVAVESHRQPQAHLRSFVAVHVGERRRLDAARRKSLGDHDRQARARCPHGHHGVRPER